jgi:hypothetical protein
VEKVESVYEAVGIFEDQMTILQANCMIVGCEAKNEKERKTCLTLDVLKDRVCNYLSVCGFKRKKPCLWMHVNTFMNVKTAKHFQSPCTVIVASSARMDLKNALLFNVIRPVVIN